MSGIEQQNIPEIAKDIYLKVQDGDLKEAEKKDIVDRYEAEKCHIQATCQQDIQELHSFLDIFQESLTLDRETIKQLQQIIGCTPEQTDGRFGPQSFQTLITFRKEIGFSGTIQELLAKYQIGDIPLEETHTVEENRNHIPGNQHPEQEREESIEEKTQRLIAEANTFPKTLIGQLQKSLGGIGVDGSFGPQSLQKLLEVYPEIHSIQEAFDQAGIDTDIDDVLVGPEATEKAAQERFRELYGEFIGVLGDKLGLPDGLIDSIVAVETTYGKDLGSGTGSKGLMQLTNSPFEDMKQDSYRVGKYAPIYQDLDLDTLLSLQIDGKTVEERMPQNIVEAFKILARPETSVTDFQTQIQILQDHLKGRGSGHDHEANLLIGAVYLAYQYRRHDGNVSRAARDYNGEANGGNTRYARNVVRKLESYEREGELS